MVFVSWLCTRKKINPSAHTPPPKIPERIKSNMTTNTIKIYIFLKLGV